MEIATEKEQQAYVDGRTIERLEHDLRLMFIRIKGDIKIRLNPRTKRIALEGTLASKLRSVKHTYQKAIKIKRKYGDMDLSELNGLYRQFIKSYNELKKELADYYKSEEVVRAA